MERILAFSEEFDLLPRDGLILCALSGGRDSVALLHFLKERGYSLAAAHFDHHLRENSGEDARFCRELCENWGVPFYQGEGDVAAMAGNTEANARAARYAFLEETAQAIGAQRIATAHNGDDNLETILLHLTRGCGLNGLAGIQPRRGSLVRPMLCVPRAAVDAYVAAHRLAYVEDSSNSDVRFSRNRLRHQVVPVLKSINPRVVEVSAVMAGTLREDLQFLRSSGRAGPEGIASDRAGSEGTAPGRETARRACPRIEPVPAPTEGRVAAGLWALTARPVDHAPDTPPTPHAFTLRFPCASPALYLRSRRAGDALHPPFRTGKTVKKWFNECKVPPPYRDGYPVLADEEDRVVSVAGIGPNREFLAKPGESGIFFQWTKEREEP